MILMIVWIILTIDTNTICLSSQITVMVQRKFTPLGISAIMDMSVRQRGEPGQAPVPIPPLKQTNTIILGDSKSRVLMFDMVPN